MLLVNLLPALNFANVFKNKKVWKIKKTLRNVKNVTKRKKGKKVFLHLCSQRHPDSLTDGQNRPEQTLSSAGRSIAVLTTLSTVAEKRETSSFHLTGSGYVVHALSRLGDAQITASRAITKPLLHVTAPSGMRNAVHIGAMKMPPSTDCCCRRRRQMEREEQPTV